MTRRQGCSHGRLAARCIDYGKHYGSGSDSQISANQLQNRSYRLKEVKSRFVTTRREPSLFSIMAKLIGSVISNIIGWTYFVAWSLSFYPQAFLNWKTRSVQGLSIDFLSYNSFGFFCYALFNLSFYFNKDIRNKYKERHHSNENLVRANDVFFSVHACLISVFMLWQTRIYKKKHAKQHLSSTAGALIWIATIGAVILMLVIHFGNHLWIDLMYYLSCVKLATDVIKYLPQARLNYKRKSTVGWSIHIVILDLIGGSLSVIQLVLDAYLERDWSGISGNLVKLGVGLITIAFDILFLAQHYILYRPHTEQDLGIEEEVTPYLRNYEFPSLSPFFYMLLKALRRWAILWLLRLTVNIGNYKYARRLMTLLQLLFDKADPSWTQSTLRGTWIANGVGHAKREELQDQINACNVIVLWIPGGGFRLNFGHLYTSTFVQWICAMETSKNSKCAVFVANYAKSPEFKYPQAAHDIIAAHRFLVDEMGIPADRIIWGADDSGAAIALDALYIMQKEKSDTRPEGLVLASPYIGMDAGGDSWRKNGGKDYLNAGGIAAMELAYLPREMTNVGDEDDDNIAMISTHGEDQPFQYLSREINGVAIKLGSFLPRRLLMIAGKNEVLLDDASDLATRADKEGVHVEKLLQPGQTHLWSMFGPVVTQDVAAWQKSVDQWVNFVGQK